METLTIRDIRDFEIEATVERLIKIVNDNKANVEINADENPQFNSCIKGNKDGLLLLAADLLAAARTGNEDELFLLNEKLTREDTEKALGYIQLIEDEAPKADTKKLTLKDRFLGFIFLILLALYIVMTGWIVDIL